MTMTKLGDFFRVERGDVKKVTQLTESSAENSIRLISATHFDNGGNLFYIPTTETVYKSGLTINNNGSVGDVFSFLSHQIYIHIDTVLYIAEKLLLKTNIYMHLLQPSYPLYEFF